MESISSVKPIIDIFTALLSPVIAISVAYIAFQQWKLNANKEKREVNSQKLHIYMGVKRFLRYVDNNRTIKAELYDDLQESIALADFVFDEYVTNWLFDVDCASSAWLDLSEVNRSHKDKISPQEFNKNEVELSELIDELQNHHCQLLDTFKSSMVQ